MKVDTDAVKAAVQTIPALASKTFVAVAPRTNGALPTAPYVVIFPADGVDRQDRVTGPYSTRYPTFLFHIVGSSYDNAQTVTELVKAKFVVAGRGVKLTIAGSNTKPCQWSAPLPIQVDNDLTPPLIYSVAELTFQVDPTP